MLEKCQEWDTWEEVKEDINRVCLCEAPTA